MFTSFSISTIDPFLGRLDYDSLSDQTLIEMLVDGLNAEDKKSVQDENGNFQDISEWILNYNGDNFAFTDSRVTKLRIFRKKFSDKQFPFQFIPPLVEFFSVSSCALHGTLDTSVLPRGLIVLFNVGNNQLHGSIDWKSFPRKLQRIEVYYNNFTGSISLSDLPETLSTLSAHHNKFSGEIELNDIPRTMKYLELHNNSLSGSIRIESLPPSIQVIDLAKNSLVGDFMLLDYPKSLRRIDIGKGMFDRVVLRKTSEEMHFRLVCSGARAIVDQNGKSHAWEKYIIEGNMAR